MEGFGVALAMVDAPSASAAVRWLWMRVRHVRGEEEAERLDDAFGGGITELFPVSIHVDGGEGAPRVLCEDPRLAPFSRTHQTANAGVHEHTKKSIQIFTDRPGYVGADHKHLSTIRQLPSTRRSMVGRCSTEKVDFGRLTPNFLCS